MVKNKKLLKIGALVLFTLLFVTFTVFAFFVPSTASANNLTSVTTFTTPTYHTQMVYYKKSPGSTVMTADDLQNLFSTFYFVFDVSSVDISVYMYYLENNYSLGNVAGYMPYSLIASDYNTFDVQTLSISYGSSGRRYIDYTLQSEILVDSITDVTPTYMTVDYKRVLMSPGNWSIKDAYTRDLLYIENGVCLMSYTFGNSQYRMTFTFIGRTTSDWVSKVINYPQLNYSTTMFFGNSEGENPFNTGYDLGYKEGKIEGVSIGKQEADSTVNKDSASYLQGMTDALNEDNPYTFLGMFGAIADSQLTFIDGLLGFNFLGINMLSFFKFLITLGLVFCVYRMLKG